MDPDTKAVIFIVLGVAVILFATGGEGCATRIIRLMIGGVLALALLVFLGTAHT